MTSNSSTVTLRWPLQSPPQLPGRPPAARRAAGMHSAPASSSGPDHDAMQFENRDWAAHAQLPTTVRRQCGNRQMCRATAAAESAGGLVVGCARCPTLPSSRSRPVEAFDEKQFYLDEFRGHTLVFSIPVSELGSDTDYECLAAMVRELLTNDTRVIVLVGAPDHTRSEQVLRRLQRRLGPLIFRDETIPLFPQRRARARGVHRGSARCLRDAGVRVGVAQRRVGDVAPRTAVCRRHRRCGRGRDESDRAAGGHPAARPQVDPRASRRRHLRQRRQAAVVHGRDHARPRCWPRVRRNGLAWRSAGRRSKRCAPPCWAASPR